MTFKICTVGCGGMSTAVHGPSHAKYAATHPDTLLAACCDLDEQKAVRYRDKFGYARHYTDLVKMLEAERPDAVCLIAPVDLTCELSCRILAMGFPLLMEKPPGKTITELDRMIAAAEARGVPTQVAFNRRYTPVVRALKGMVADIQHIRYDFTRIGRKDADFSTTAIHGIDTARFLAGSDYKRIRFHYQEFPHLGPTVANIFMDCAFASGATAHLNFCPVSGVVVERASVYAYDNTFFMNIPISQDRAFPAALQHYEKNKLKRELSPAEAAGGAEWFEMNGFYGENAAFFDDIRSGRRPKGDLRSGRQSVEIADCIRRRQQEYDA